MLSIVPCGSLFLPIMPLTHESPDSPTAFRNLYGFLSQILPSFDAELERLFAFLRHLTPKLPLPGDGAKFTLDDDVAPKFFRLQQVSEWTIDLTQGEADPLEGPSDLGTGREKDTDVALSTSVKQINERCGAEFTEADQLFFDQMRATAELDEKVVEDAASSGRRGTRWPVMEAR